MIPRSRTVPTSRELSCTSTLMISLPSAIPTTSLSSSVNWPASISFRMAIAVTGFEMLPMRIIVVGSMARPVVESISTIEPFRRTSSVATSNCVG